MREAKWAALPESERLRRQELHQRRRERIEQVAPPNTKTCLACLEVRPMTEYTPVRARPGSYYPRCRVCRNQYERTRYYARQGVTPDQIAWFMLDKARRTRRAL
jgi:hypothetical protein